jgi:hypothetical protein
MLRSLRQEDCEFKSNLGYIGSPCFRRKEGRKEGGREEGRRRKGGKEGGRKE